MGRKTNDGKMPVKSDGVNKGGRPVGTPVLTPELIEKIVAPLRMGVRIPTAGALNNIAYDTLRHWVLQGHENPDSVYGMFIQEITRAIAQWETGDISAIHKAAFGAPAEYLMEPAFDTAGQPLKGDDGKILMRVARDNEGRPIIKRSEVRPDWRAAAHRLERRLPKYWYRPETQSAPDHDAVLTFDAKEREVKPVEALSFEQKIAGAVKKLEEDY